jgi:DNA-binding CsgD family transcriptional regulator
VVSRGAAMAFRHPLIRDVLCAQLAAGVRGAWHVELALALAQRGADAAVVARQLTAAVECGVGLPASDWLTGWLVAEGPALASQAVAVAVTLFQHALGHVAAGDPRRPGLAVALVSALYAAARFEEADRVAGQALSAGPGRIGAGDALTLYLLMVDNLQMRGKYAEVRAVLDQAEAERAWDPAQGLRLQISSLKNRVNTDDTAAEIWHKSHDLLPVAERLGDAWAIAALYEMLADISVVPSTHEDIPADDSLRYIDRALAALEGHRELLDQKLWLLGKRADKIATDLRFEEAAEAAVRVREIAERTGGRRYLGWAAFVNSICLFERGAWDDLPVEADTAHEAGWPSQGVAALAAIAALHRDDEPQAEPYVRRTADAASRLGTANGAESSWAWVLSLQLRRAGRDPEALERLMTGEHPAAAWWHDRFYTPRVQAVRLAVSLGDREAAQQVLRWNENRPNLHPGVRAQCRGLADRDPQSLSRAADIYRSAGQKLQLAEATEDLGIVLAERGDRAAAPPHKIEAVRVYEELGAVWDLNRMRARFREYGIRTGSHAARRRPVAGWDSLTGTEARIAALVAQGESNPQIAIELYLSRRTVETHVSHILAKLGGRSRVDVARLAAQRTARTAGRATATTSGVTGLSCNAGPFAPPAGRIPQPRSLRHTASPARGQETSRVVAAQPKTCWYMVQLRRRRCEQSIGPDCGDAEMVRRCPHRQPPSLDTRLTVGISPGTVKSRVHYALLALRKELAPTLRIIGVGPPPRATSPATG